MTTDDKTVLPPRWAEGLLRLLLRPDDRDSVSGDLLEEYRETIAPAIGSGADWWYVRQVGWFVWHAAWMWGAAGASMLVLRYLFDTRVPVTDYLERSRWMTLAIMATFGAAAFWHTWRTGRIRTGLLVAFVAGAMAGVLSSIGTGVLLTIWHDPATLREWGNSGGLDEAFIVVPLLMLPISLLAGIAGAIAAKGLRLPLKRRA